MRSKTISQATVEGKKVADIHVGEMIRGLGTGRAGVWASGED